MRLEQWTPEDRLRLVLWNQGSTETTRAFRRSEGSLRLFYFSPKRCQKACQRTAV
jgi:hypothetical protein